jgi:hypothetical protein
MGSYLEHAEINRHWTPATAEERERVHNELEAILSSYHFRGSKRYPALLRYVVEAALENRLSDLKERTLGVEVFGRDPNYDTNADPVVRISAGEVRKRIAQYYHENGQHSRVQIELPLGSYVPEFLHTESTAVPDSTGIRNEEREDQVERQSHPQRKVWRPMVLGLAAVVLVSAPWAAFLYRQDSAGSADAVVEKLWAPLLQSSRPVLIVVGTSHPDQMAPETDETSFTDHMNRPYHHVSVSTAIALAHLGGVLRQHGKDYEIKEAPETSLTDIRSRSLILVGAMNNDWTRRLLRPLKIHFGFVDKVASIQDADHPERNEWALDFSKPYVTVTTDYALVARFRDPTTEGPVMVIAGLGPYGTEASSEFAQSPQYLVQLAAKLPRGWENKNLEFVLKTNVIGSKGGPPILLSAITW